MELIDLIFLGTCVLMSGRHDPYADDETITNAILKSKKIWAEVVKQDKEGYE